MRGSIDHFFYRIQNMKEPKISPLGDMKAKALRTGQAISIVFFHYYQISPYYQAMVNNIAEEGPGVKPPSVYERQKVT